MNSSSHFSLQMSPIERRQTSTAGSSGAVLCRHRRPAVRRISRQPRSREKPFFTCYLDRDDPNHCRFFQWDTAPPPGDESGTRAPVEVCPPSASSSRPPYRGRAADNTLAFSGQFRESVGSSVLKDTTSKPGSMIVSRHSTQTDSHPHLKRSIIEADEIGIVDVIDNQPEFPLQYATQISPRPQKITCTRPETPSRENGYLSFLPQSKYGTKPPDPTDQDETKTQEIGFFEITSPLTSDRHKHREPVAAPSEAAPTHPMMSAETIQDIVNALSIIPTYVRELERQNSFLQKSSEMKAIRLLQLEKELLEVRSSQGSSQ